MSKPDRSLPLSKGSAREQETILRRSTSWNSHQMELASTFLAADARATKDGWTTGPLRQRRMSWCSVPHTRKLATRTEKEAMFISIHIASMRESCHQNPIHQRSRPTPTFNYAPQPNWSFKRTPTLAMASPFSWPVSVPYALSGSGAA